MRLAVADTGPLHYLVLIGEIGIIPTLIDEVLIPPEVRDEIDRPQTPAPVRAWIAAPPPWLRVQPSPQLDTAAGLARLDPGERAAIALARVKPRGMDGITPAARRVGFNLRTRAGAPDGVG
jgi:predicted nucleic acid-binding protein